MDSAAIQNPVIRELLERIESLEAAVVAMRPGIRIDEDRIAAIEEECGCSIRDLFVSECMRGELSLAEFADSIGLSYGQAKRLKIQFGLVWAFRGNGFNKGNPKLPDLNKARTKYFVTTESGEVISLADFCKLHGLVYGSVINRARRRGVSIQEALFIPPKKRIYGPQNNDHPWRRK